MPAKYEAIRNKLIREGRSAANAKRIAAKIYNSQRKPGQAPVHPSSHRGKRED